MTEANSLIETKKSIFIPIQEKFLTHKHRAKLSTEFKVGKNQITIYGHPLIMSENSELIDSMMDQVAESTEPIPLMSLIDVEERALQIVWLYLHKFNHGLLPITQLTLTEILSMFDIFKYLHIFMSDDLGAERFGFYGKWVSGFKAQFKKENKQVLIDNKERVAGIINQLNKMNHNVYLYGYIFSKLDEIGAKEVIELINYTIVIEQDLNRGVYYRGLIEGTDKKNLDDIEVDNVRFIKQDDGYYTKTNSSLSEFGLMKYELKPDTPGAVIFKMVLPPIS